MTPPTPAGPANPSPEGGEAPPAPVIRSRRPAPDFRPGHVLEVGSRSARLAVVVLSGDGYGSMAAGAPAASVRLLLPRHGASAELELPRFDGNAFYFADGTRPPVRTLTPLGADHPDRLRVEIVRHGAGLLAEWLGEVTVGDAVGVSGPGAGFPVEPDAARYLVVGDESALPAITQLMDRLPDRAAVEVAVELGAPEGRVELPAHPGADVTWLNAASVPGAAMVDWVADRELAPDVRVWAAGEAAAVQRLRGIVVGERGIPRSQTVIRGYWKQRDAIPRTKTRQNRG